tara:strand:+ start:92 stop:931 length:840 start_codon:yes stop_codon:yes gene_type:complete
MSQTEVQLIKNNAVVEADIANDAVTRDKINVVSTSSAPGIEIKGDDGSQEGYLQLNCRVNSHGVKIQSPPHSASQSYKIILPDNQIAADKFLKVKSITGSGSTATGQLEFSDVTAGSTAYSYIDQWALNTNLTVGGSTVYWASSQLSRSDSYAVTIGSAMTVDTNGVFTFPATGIYRVYARHQYLQSSTASRYIGTNIQGTTNSGSNWSNIADSIDAMPSISGATYVNGVCEAFFDVTNVSTHRIRFGAYSASNVTIQGSEHGSSMPTTFFRFIKVADT